MRLTIRIAALSALLTLGAAAGAQAQAQDDPRGPYPMAGQAPPQMQAQMKAMREARQHQRAQDLRTILRLRPDQEPALTAFLQSHEPPGGGSMGRPQRRGPPDQAMTTPQRLDEMARREAEHDALRQRRTDALRAFYAALGPDQRQVFDALQRMDGPGREHGRGDGGGPGGWGRHGFRGPAGGPSPGSPSPGGPPPRD